MLNPYRFFDPDEYVRKIAFELYQEVKGMPILSPHGHVNPSLLAYNEPFPDPTELIILPDHYIYRLLYSQGISMESLGIPARDGTEVEQDHRKIWKIFADHYYLFAGTPTGIWLNHELSEVFGIEENLDSENAMAIYDELSEKLKSEEFLPRRLFERFGIEVLTTTDGAVDSLEHHQKIQLSEWKGRVIPCFRPDAVIDIRRPDWNRQIEALSEASRIMINSFPSFIAALENRREFFKSMGAVSTDQGILSPYTNELDPPEVENIFQRALKWKSTEEDGYLFTAHMLMEMARMSIEDGMVMQIHPGSFRNHNQALFDRFGYDKGADIPVQTEYTRNLHPLLNKFGNDRRFTLVVFTLDESTYSRELAPLAGHYPAMKLGAPWWFHDSIQGMLRFREHVMETASIYNTVGFTDDTRAFPSIPARHDLSRRMDSNFLARMVARHTITMNQAKIMNMELAYKLAKRTYNL
ncbi:MAG: glucuronate isomerase [Calditrichaeota bacterium]|nr:glucuronate isomerase [Calditrichota bacterium]